MSEPKQREKPVTGAEELIQRIKKEAEKSFLGAIAQLKEANKKLKDEVSLLKEKVGEYESWKEKSERKDFQTFSELKELLGQYTSHLSNARQEIKITLDDKSPTVKLKTEPVYGGVTLSLLNGTEWKPLGTLTRPLVNTLAESLKQGEEAAEIHNKIRGHLSVIETLYELTKPKVEEKKEAEAVKDEC